MHTHTNTVHVLHSCKSIQVSYMHSWSLPAIYSIILLSVPSKRSILAIYIGLQLSWMIWNENTIKMKEYSVPALLAAILLFWRSIWGLLVCTIEFMSKFAPWFYFGTAPGNDKFGCRIGICFAVFHMFPAGIPYSGYANHFQYICPNIIRF